MLATHIVYDGRIAIGCGDGGTDGGAWGIISLCGTGNAASFEVQHRSRVTSQIHASYTRVLPVPHATRLIITTPIEMAPKS